MFMKAELKAPQKPVQRQMIKYMALFAHLTKIAM